VNPELVILKPMAAIHFFSLNQPPEEEALTAALQYADKYGLTEQTSRLFGRNIYLTNQPEPHGYEYYLTIDKTSSDKKVESDLIAGGLYAVLEIKNLFSITEGWKTLNEWIQSNGHKTVGVKRGPHGWVNNAYEELLDWQQQKPPEQWRFRLWMQLQE
jgi:hypothetical protein